MWGARSLRCCTTANAPTSWICPNYWHSSYVPNQFYLYYSCSYLYYQPVPHYSRPYYCMVEVFLNVLSSCDALSRHTMLHVPSVVTVTVHLLHQQIWWSILDLLWLPHLSVSNYQFQLHVYFLFLYHFWFEMLHKLHLFTVCPVTSYCRFTAA